MALADSARAIGATTRTVVNYLSARVVPDVKSGRPEKAAGTGPRLNIFLYEAQLDGALKNTPRLEGEPVPLWMVLKYLLTAYDNSGDSDTAEAHELVGRAMSALQVGNFLALGGLSAADRTALENNPEPLKVTFDDASPDLLSKVMQGTDEKYRVSVAFQVRPVMILPPEPQRFGLLVGVDYTRQPAATIGLDGVVLDVLPSLGPRLLRMDPASFDAGAEVELFGDDLHLSNLECTLGSIPLRIVSQRPDRIIIRVQGPQLGAAPEDSITAGTALSAGEHPLALRQRLTGNRTRGSNLLVARLRPTVTTAQIVGGQLRINGLLLGTAADDIVVAFHAGGGIVRSFDTPAVTAGQKRLVLSAADLALIPAGTYAVLVRVNGQQATIGPSLVIP
jgi:hypothetical protein